MYSEKCNANNNEEILLHNYSSLEKSRKYYDLKQV